MRLCGLNRHAGSMLAATFAPSGSTARVLESERTMQRRSIRSPATRVRSSRSSRLTNSTASAELPTMSHSTWYTSHFPPPPWLFQVHSESLAHINLHSALPRFYVGCDECEDWFHPACVGISQQEAEAQDSYICPGCQESVKSTTYNMLVRGAVFDALKNLIKMVEVR